MVIRSTWLDQPGVSDFTYITGIGGMGALRVIPADYGERRGGGFNNIGFGFPMGSEAPILEDFTKTGIPAFPVFGLPEVLVSADEVFNPTRTVTHTTLPPEWDFTLPEQTELPILPSGVVPMNPLDWQPGDAPIQTTDWDVYGQLVHQGIGALNPNQTAGLVSSGSGDATMAQDWGDFLSGLGQDWITSQIGGGPMYNQSPTGTTNLPASVPSVVAPAVGAGLGAAAAAWKKALDVTPESYPDKRNMYWNPRKAQWERRKSRRRRRLLTEQDYADLAKLQSLTGKGQAFTVAVMKAVRR